MATVMIEQDDGGQDQTVEGGTLGSDMLMKSRMIL